MQRENHITQIMTLNIDKSPYFCPMADEIFLVMDNDYLASSKSTESIKDNPIEYDWDPEQ